jgi:thioredoxin reductase
MNHTASRETSRVHFDVIIVGAGPAGLTAALILGRCRRQVLVCDAAHPRNAASPAMHGYLTRDGIAPDEFLQTARTQLRPYSTVSFIEDEATDVASFEGGFTVRLLHKAQYTCRKLLLATGVVDSLPPIPGIEQFYGRSVHHCPYCDGWEKRDQPLAVYGQGDKGCDLALMLTLWSEDLVLCTDGPAGLSDEQRARLAHHNIPVREEPIARLEGTPDGMLERLVFASEETLTRHALFFNTGQTQRSSLFSKLGCDFTGKGGVRSRDTEETNVPGLYVAGDASRDVQFVIVAAAEGAQAAVAINKALLREDGLC